MREQNLQGVLCHTAPASFLHNNIMHLQRNYEHWSCDFVSVLTASVGTYNMLLGALLDVGDSESMEQFVVSS